MPVFRPSCQVRLQLYLDEGAKGITPKSPASAASLSKAGIDASLNKNLTDRQVLGKLKPSLSLAKFNQEIAKLDMERDDLEKKKLGLQQPLPSGVDPNLSTDGAVIFTAIPATATVVRAPTKDADTLQLVFAYSDLPIDPRCVRSALVGVALGTTDREDYENGMLRELRRAADGSLTSIVLHEDGQEQRLHSTTRFVGFVSVWKCSFGLDGDIVVLDCVDVSAVLRQQPLLGHKIDMTKPVDVGVQNLIDEFPTSKGIKVVLGTPVADEVQKPTGTLVPADILPPALKTRKGKVAKANTKSEKMTVWDHITDTCLRLGLIPVMRQFTLYLLEPRVLFRDLLNPIRMVYGRNIERLEMARKMEGITTDTIEIRCPDRSIGRVRWARYPVLSGEPKSGILGKPGSPQPVLSRSSKVTPNGTGHEVVRVLTVRGVAELATLEKIAESTFHEIGRQEIVGSFSTYDIDSFEAETEADLLDLQSGDAVMLLVEQQASNPEEVGATTYQELQLLSVSARQRYLEGLKISPENARKLALAHEQAQVQTVFRVGTVTIHWSTDDGVSIEVDYYNFIVVREDPDSEGKALGPRATTLSGAMKAVK